MAHLRCRILWVCLVTVCALGAGARAGTFAWTGAAGSSEWDD